MFGFTFPGSAPPASVIATTVAILGATTGTYTITGSAASLLYARVFAADVGAYALTGVAAGLLKSFYTGATVGSYLLAGVATTLTFGSFPHTSLVGVNLTLVAINGINKPSRVVTASYQLSKTLKGKVKG